MAKKISQAEAKRLRRRVKELEDVLLARSSTRFLGSVKLNQRSWFAGRMEAARELGHPLLATVNDEGEIRISAIRIQL